MVPYATLHLHHGDEENDKNIKEASQYVPSEQICLSPQCGLTSTHHRNVLAENEQWEKLKFIAETAKEILG